MTYQPDWSFRFKNAELRVALSTSKAGHSIPAGAENVESERLRKPIELLVQYLLKRETARSTVEERRLFDATPRGSAYRAICMVERCRLLYSSLACPIPTLHSSSSERVKRKYLRWINEWFDLYEDGRGEEVAKFQSTFMFNLFWKVEAPKLVDLPRGWVWGQMCPFKTAHRRCIRYFSKCRSRDLLKESMRIAQCFLFFKKGCPPASSSFIDNTMRKHKVALTTKHPRLDHFSFKNPDSGECTFIPRSAFKTRIDDLTKAVFRNYRHPVEFREPSKSASFRCTRSDGGQLSELKFRFPSCYGLRSVFCCFDHWDFFDTGYDVIKVPKGVYLHLGLKSRPTPQICAQPIALTEPLKVRVITKENAWSTYVLSGAQRNLWRCLKKFPWFRLTGRPINVFDIPLGAQNWISVDYSAATDNLASEFSKLVIRSICRVTGLPYKLCRDSLIRHALYYGEEKPVEQTNGQLMGSILSFIVLCICNGVVISLASNPAKFDLLLCILLLFVKPENVQACEFCLRSL